MGTNNSYLSQHTTPALTTVEVPYAEIGKKAVELLITQVTDLNKTPSSYLEDCQLVLRSSTGPAPDQFSLTDQAGVIDDHCPLSDSPPGPYAQTHRKRLRQPLVLCTTSPVQPNT